MSLQQFISSPWSSHKAYEYSFLTMEAAVETCTSEVLVASLYRAIGFEDHRESEVSRYGGDFLKRSEKEGKTGEQFISGDTWRTVLKGILASPRQAGQSAQRSLQLTPLIPDVALYSGAARIRGNPWNPGRLIAGMVQRGSESIEAANAIWEELFNALSVTENDDVWARWLQAEFGRRQKSGDPTWRFVPLKPPATMMDKAEKAQLDFPAKQFVKDLGAILDAKESMTRRQWTSLLEGLLRIAATSHVLWVCSVNRRMWQVVRAILEGQSGRFDTQQKFHDYVFGNHEMLLSYGKQAVPLIRDIASAYLSARLGINLVLFMLDPSEMLLQGVASPTEAWNFVRKVQANLALLADGKVMEKFHALSEEETTTISCKKGIGKNITEFARYAMAQRQTSDPARRSYDQSYYLAKAGPAQNAPWVVSMGPVAVLAMVHCCLAEAAGPRSVSRLCAHLGAFGLRADLDDINTSDLGRTLRMLGLVLDSPDAESGMLLLPPFSVLAHKEEN